MYYEERSGKWSLKVGPSLSVPPCADPFAGTLDSLKHVKKDITEARKGSECGLSVHGYKEIQEGDVIVAYQKVEKPREL